VPNYFGRFSAGLVWIPRPGSAVRPAVPATPVPVESEIIFEGMNSVGHFMIFANSWRSYLSACEIEYNRHSWGTFIGARLDYSAEILPAIILRQPTITDVWGKPPKAQAAHTANLCPASASCPSACASSGAMAPASSPITSSWAV
jgi:hypothetical protein